MHLRLVADRWLRDRANDGEINEAIEFWLEANKENPGHAD